MEEIIKVIQQIIPLTDEEQQLIISNFSFSKLRASENVLSEGAVCKYEYYVQAGLLRSCVNYHENERTIQFHKEGDWVCDYRSFLNKEPSKISIQAIEDSVLLKISSSGLQQLDGKIKNWDRVARFFFENLTRSNQKSIHDLIAKNPEEKYLMALEELKDIIDRIPQYLLAQYIGIQPESLSRLKKRIFNRHLNQGQ